MNNIKTALIYCFSGTGNTEKMANEYKKIFEENNVTTTIYKVSNDFSNMPNNNDYDLIGIAYPIHGFNPPYPILDIVKEFPKVDNKQLFIIKSSGEPLTINNVSSAPIMSTLKNKGYILTNEYHYVMPYNIIFRHTDEMAAKMYRTAKALCSIEAMEVLRGEKNLLKKFPFERLISFIFRIEHPAMKINGNLFKVKKFCIHCNLCVKKCPINNIYNDENGDIKFKNKCVMCTACAFHCPVDAITIGILNGWRVNGPYKFNNPPKAKEDKHKNYCKKAYAKYFKKKKKKITNYSLYANNEIKSKLNYKNIEEYLIKENNINDVEESIDV